MTTPPGSLPATTIRSYLLRNTVLAMSTDMGWGFAMALVAIGPVLSVLLERLGATKAVIGLAPALMMTGFSVLQLPGKHWTRRLRTKKLALTVLHYPPCVWWVVAAVLMSRWGLTQPRAVIWVVLATLALFTLGLSLLIPLWNEFLPRIFGHRRGIGTGLISAASGMGGVLGGLYVTHVLRQRAFPDNYAHLFLMAGVVAAAAISLYFFLHEEVPAEQAAGEAPLEESLSLRAAAGSVWRGDRRLRRLVFIRYLWETGQAATVFFALYAVAKFRLPASATGYYVLAGSVGATVLAPWLGHLGDRRGYRRTLGWGMLALVAATALALVAPSWLFWLVFALAGVATTCDFVGGTNLLVEMSGEHTRGYYQALLATGLIPLRLVAPVAWGWLGDENCLVLRVDPLRWPG